MPFPDVMSLGDQFNQLSIELPVIDSDLFTLTYPNVMPLVRELKGLGASSSAISGRSGGLYGRRLLKELEHAYGIKHRMEDGKIRATFEALQPYLPTTSQIIECGYNQPDDLAPLIFYLQTNNRSL